MKYIGNLRVASEGNTDLMELIRTQENAIYPEFQLLNPKTLLNIRELFITVDRECDIIINKDIVTLQKGSKSLRTRASIIKIVTPGVTAIVDYAYGDYNEFLTPCFHECENGESGGGTFDSNVTVGTTNITCGAIPANTIIEDMPNEELWKKLLIQQLAPLVTISGNPTIGLREVGEETNIVFSAKVEKRSGGGDISSVKFESSPVVSNFDLEDSNPNPTTNSYTRSGVSINNTTVFQVSGTDALGKVGKASLSYVFVRPTYFGMLTEDFNDGNITAEVIVENAVKTLKTKGNISATLTTPEGENRKFFFAYQKGWGEAESIMDVANSFNLIGNCSKTEVDIECLDGEVITYICYIANIGGQYVDKLFSLNFPVKAARSLNEPSGILLIDEANNDRYRLCVDSGNLYLRKEGE